MIRSGNARRLSSQAVRCRTIAWHAVRGLTIANLFAVSLLVGTLGLVSFAGPAAAEEPDEATSSELDIFEIAAQWETQRRLTLDVIRLFQAGRPDAAEQALRLLIERYPDWPVHHYNLAAALALQRREDAALDSLEEALARGFANLDAMERDTDLDALRGLDRFANLLGALRERAAQAASSPGITASPIRDGLGLVERSNTVWEPRSGTLVSTFSFGDKPPDRRVRAGSDRISRRLNLWFATGEGAGNHGDLYDNRDAGHSSLDADLFPQLSHVEYGPEAVAAGMHYGPNPKLLFNAITIGNSSTAITGGAWRSQARLIETSPAQIGRAYQQYLNDHLYVFPEHRDHDPEHGDLFPANSPYMLISQGSSGSDRPLLYAVVSTLAAFSPETKAFLRERHLVMPTVQMILRSSLKLLETDDDYLTGRAHPSVFDADEIDIAAMIIRAHDLKAGEVPPRVDLAIVEEERPTPGVDYFGPSATDEVLFDTPSAIARVVRSTAFERRMVVSAERTADPNGLPLRFHWTLLRGDLERVEIVPLNDEGTVAELRVGWHEPRPVPFNDELTTSRVDIGVFADNGHHHSAPAFVSFYFPPNQVRTYDEDGRVLEISYDGDNAGGRYVDPILFARRGWTDRYLYSSSGEADGWERTDAEGTARYMADGARVAQTDERGRPVRGEQVRYEIEAETGGERKLVIVPTGRFSDYAGEGAPD